MILLTHNMLASPMKEAARQLPLGDFLNHDARPPAECSPEWQRHGLRSTSGPGRHWPCSQVISSVHTSTLLDT